MSNPNSDNEIELVRQCIRRDLTAWSHFINKYSPLISISISCRLRKYGFSLPSHDIDDIRQSVLTSIWQGKKLEGVSNLSNITYWLAVVSGNYALEHLRNNRIFGNANFSQDVEASEALMEDLLPSSGGSGYEPDRQELMVKVDEALDSLPPQERLIIKLNLIHGKKYEEIADMLDIHLGTVASSIKRAKDKLKEKLKEYL